MAALTMAAMAMRDNQLANQMNHDCRDGTVPSHEFPGTLNLSGAHSGVPGWLGGAQNSEKGLFMGIEYNKIPQTALDRTLNFVVEHFSGTHDFLDMVTGQYQAGGILTSDFGSTDASWVVSVGMVPVATPFAVASMTAGAPAMAMVGLDAVHTSW